MSLARKRLICRRVRELVSSLGGTIDLMRLDTKNAPSERGDTLLRIEKELRHLAHELDGEYFQLLSPEEGKRFDRPRG